MIPVPVKNGNLDFAIRRYKQKLAKDGVPSEAKKHDAYDKPGVRRRKAKEAAKKNARKNNARKSNSYKSGGYKESRKSE